LFANKKERIRQRYTTITPRTSLIDFYFTFPEIERRNSRSVPAALFEPVDFQSIFALRKIAIHPGAGLVARFLHSSFFKSIFFFFFALSFGTILSLS
jgi:hypothetical protein